MIPSIAPHPDRRHPQELGPATRGVSLATATWGTTYSKPLLLPRPAGESTVARLIDWFEPIVSGYCEHCFNSFASLKEPIEASKFVDLKPEPFEGIAGS